MEPSSKNFLKPAGVVFARWRTSSGRDSVSAFFPAQDSPRPRIQARVGYIPCAPERRGPSSVSLPCHFLPAVTLRPV
jgi:hypothetical protein